jgi:hypothetical protein
MATLNEHDSAMSYVNNAPLINTASQPSAITAAVVAHALSATFADTEVEAALDLLGVAINSIITALEQHGIVASND